MLFCRLLILLSTHWIEARKKKWFPVEKYAAECDRIGSFDDLSFEEVAGFFAVIVIGVIVAIVALIIKYGKLWRERQVVALRVGGRHGRAAEANSHGDVIGNDDNGR